MVLKNKELLRVTASSLILLAIILVAARLVPVMFPSVPEPSDTFDCDDSTLAMYEHFQSMGIPSWPIIGNLKTDNEAFSESNHVWLLVGFGNKKIAYDWGLPRLDSQHYEGYIISLDKLEMAVAYDFSGGKDGYLASSQSSR